MKDTNNEKKQFSVVLMIVFLGFLGISMPYLIFPALFLNPEYSILPPGMSSAVSSLLLGITLAAYPLGQFIGSPILGSLSDDYGRKRLVSASLAISAFCNLFTGFAIEWQHLGLLIASRFASGLMEGNIAIARAIASDIKSIPKHETFGKINAASCIAYLIGPILGGALTDKNIHEYLTTSTPFYFVCFFFLALASLSTFLLKDDIKNTKESRPFWDRINLFKRLKRLISNKRLQFLLTTSTCFSLAVDMFYEFGPVHLTVKWALGPSQLIYYNGILCIALAIGNGWLPSLVSRHYSQSKAIILSITALSLYLMSMVLTDSSLVVMALFGLSGLAIGLTSTLMTVKISNSVPESIQGEVFGVQISLRVLGDALICLSGGVLLLLSSKIILTIAAALSMATMGYYYFQSQQSTLLSE